jgi:2-polyprenyl-3-methyl-5-hydroxy-6-metoxy-1,4-benzoquinol methylase
MMPASRQRIDYFCWSLGRVLTADTTCPACGSPNSRCLLRKYLVTSLHECGECRLRFRVPKELPDRAEEFYQEAYHEGMTTEMPSAAALSGLLETSFAGTDKDFRTYLDVLRAAGVRPGARLLDFGCSWGYGSWQFRRAGFEVWSAEISRPRATYAREKLACRMVEDPGSLSGAIDCFFSAHVIEHLPDPHTLLNLASRVLAPSGTMLTFCPNGDPLSSWRDHYDDLFSRKHPLVITPAFIRAAAPRHGFRVRMYSDPYDLDAIARGEEAAGLPGEELCMVMRREAR